MTQEAKIGLRILQIQKLFCSLSNIALGLGVPKLHKSFWARSSIELPEP